MPEPLVINLPYEHVESQGDVYLFDVRSESRGSSLVHRVDINAATGECSCTCESWAYTRKMGLEKTVWNQRILCKHLDRIVSHLGLKEKE